MPRSQRAPDSEHRARKTLEEAISAENARNTLTLGATAAGMEGPHGAAMLFQRENFEGRYGRQRAPKLAGHNWSKTNSVSGDSKKASNHVNLSNR